MDKLERYIKKKLKTDTEDFDVWFKKNKVRLNGFKNEEDVTERQNGRNAIVITSLSIKYK